MFTFGGAILIAIGGTIRGIEATQPYPAKFSLSFAYLILGIVGILVYKRKDGQKFMFPWQKKDQNGIKIVDKKLLLALILGGVAEFFVSLGVIFSYNAAI